MRYTIGILLTLLFFHYTSCSLKDKKEVTVAIEEPTPAIDSLRLVFVGDAMVHSTQYNSALFEGGGQEYDFYPPFQYIKAYISAADLAFANLETALGGKPYSGYPMFSSPQQIVNALKLCGFNVLFMANNHILDRGKYGLENTIQVAKEEGFYHTGAFVNEESKDKNHPLILEKNNFRIAILNYTYGTNGLVQTKPNIVNYIDTVQIKEDLRKAKAKKPDYIITVLHWGEEYQRKENSHQRLLAKTIAGYGTDMIVGSHPHVIQPIKNVITQQGDTVPVIYSLGNFISNQQKRYTDGGIALDVLLTKKEDKTTLVSIDYEPLWVNRTTKTGRYIYRIIPVNDYLKNKDKYELTETEAARINQFHEDTEKSISTL